MFQLFADTVAGSGTSSGGVARSGKPGSASSTASGFEDRYDTTTMPGESAHDTQWAVGGHMPADVLNANDPAWRVTAPTDGGGAHRRRHAGGRRSTECSQCPGSLGSVGLRPVLRGCIPLSVARGGIASSALAGSGVAIRGAVGSAGIRTEMAPVSSRIYFRFARCGVLVVSWLSAGRSGTGGRQAGFGATRAYGHGRYHWSERGAFRNGAGSRGTAESAAASPIV